MNAEVSEDSFHSTLDLDPLASMRMHGSALVDLAFGSLTRSAIHSPSRPRDLAFLPAETLELDLTDPNQRQFGDYELLELIGEGGMGVVYRARQASLDREVAVKLLAAGPWASRDFIERFRREAQNAARMQHPSIVAIYEVGSAEELHFFSMRLIRGASLAAVLKREGRQPALRAAMLMRTIAEAVDYAHRLGVLHLDLKPANVLVDENGAPHVADFGLARRLDNTLAADNDEISGTPSYMAPEQAQVRTRKITPATDIWGLGAILYELVTGRPPFLAESPQATLKLVLTESIKAPRTLVPDLSRDVEAIILKCMVRDSSQRYPTARALGDDLGRFIEGRAVVARPLNRVQRLWRWAKRQPYIAALGFLFTISMLAGIIGVTTQWKRAETNAASAQTNANRAEATAKISNQRLWESRREAALRLQAEGKGFEALPQLIDNIAEQEQAGMSDPASIERREIGMILSQGVTLINRMILPDAHPLASALSTDGSMLAIGLGDQTVRWYDTNTLSELGRVDISALPTSTGGDEGIRLLRFIDNRHLLVTLDWVDFETNPKNRDTYLIDLDRARVIEPPAQFADLSDAVYSADGHYALLFDHQHGVQFWQVEPWRALSAKTVNPLRGEDAWLLGRGGSFAAFASSGTRYLALYDPHDLSSPRKSEWATEGVAAWTENNSGSLLALGDINGHVSLLDPHTGALRQLPTPLGMEVKWLAFSEDDAWLAAVRRDGAAFAFDVTSGAPLNLGLMQQDFDVRTVAISHRERLLVASGSGETALWRLPEAGPTGLEATRLISRPARSLRALDHSVSASLQTGLLATANMDGEVRLWRLPHSTVWPASQARAGMSLPGSLYFDGEHLPDVAYDRVRVVSIKTKKATPWVKLPQPLAYAELLDDSKTLLATSGAAMYVFDAATMQARYPPVNLQANPYRLVASGDGAFAVFSFGANGADGFEEKLEAYDLKTGQRRGRDPTVKGPLRQFELAPDASRLVASGSPHGTTDVFDTATLNRLGSYPHDPLRPVVWTSFSPDSQRLWLTTRDLDDETGDNADLIAWEPVKNILSERRVVQGAFPVGVTAGTGRPILAVRDQGLLDPNAAKPPGTAHVTGDESTAEFATSHDGRLIAHVSGRDVQLYDAATLAVVGPPLRSNLGALDVPRNLAFSGDDGYLLATAAQGESLVWATPSDRRPLADIRHDAELLNPATAGRPVLEMPSTEQTALLRHRDPGPLPASEDRPSPPVARFVDGVPVPARNPGTSPLLLDLTRIYNGAPEARRNLLGTVVPSVTQMPWGVARLNGVDYDVRGIIELRWQSGFGTPATGIIPSRATGITVPAVPIAALHVLLSAKQFGPIADHSDYAAIRLHYRDGSMAVLPIRTQEEVTGSTENDAPVPVAWAYGEHLRMIGILQQLMINDPRLPNPHPERLIATLDLEASPDNWTEPVFIAITAEPVIPAANSGSKTKDTGIK